MFIAIPVGMNYRTERLPLVTFSLIGINTLVYLVSLFFFFSTDGESEFWIFTHLWLIPSACTWNAPLTSMFVHAGFFHLFGNMIFLFLFGSCVEDMIGRLRFAIFYLLGGLVAEFVYIAMLPEHFMSPHPLGGASGAISACMGMYLLLRAGADIEFKYFFWFIYIRAGEFEIPAWMAITFWFGKDLLWAVLGLVANLDLRVLSYRRFQPFRQYDLYGARRNSSRVRLFFLFLLSHKKKLPLKKGRKKHLAASGRFQGKPRGAVY